MESCPLSSRSSPSLAIESSKCLAADGGSRDGTHRVLFRGTHQLKDIAKDVDGLWRKDGSVDGHMTSFFGGKESFRVDRAQAKAYHTVTGFLIDLISWTNGALIFAYQMHEICVL